MHCARALEKRHFDTRTSGHVEAFCIGFCQDLLGVKLGGRGFSSG
jgi:hypothetical protein